ncbi:MAG: hypothetical protein ABSC93_07100 [Bryobacteraceae bacterium]|jgi:predicted nucleic acid-binding protein
MTGKFLLDTNIVIALLQGDAATARCHDMVLVTRDRHFLEVEDLKTADWRIAP